MELDSRSLERLVPDELEPGHVTGSETLRLHLERYEFAARHARPGRLLDMACGVGYGTRLLVDRVRPPVSAMGVDISEEAIAYARKRYGGCDVEFRGANALQFHDPDGFDTIVSIETLEQGLEGLGGFFGAPETGVGSTAPVGVAGDLARRLPDRHTRRCLAGGEEAKLVTAGETSCLSSPWRDILTPSPSFGTDAGRARSTSSRVP